MKTPKNIVILLSALFLASCGQEEEVSIEPSPAPEATTLADLLLPEAPAGAVSVTEVRKNVTAGTEVVLAGDIIGKPEVFVENRAMLTIGDPNAITSCNRMPEDHCETPWDVCCDDPDLIKRSIATVQVLDSEGKLLKEGLKGLGDMKELSQIVVKGTVAEGSSADNFVINATGIHIASVEPNNSPKEHP